MFARVLFPVFAKLPPGEYWIESSFCFQSSPPRWRLLAGEGWRRLEIKIKTSITELFSNKIHPNKDWHIAQSPYFTIKYMKANLGAKICLANTGWGLIFLPVFATPHNPTPLWVFRKLAIVHCSPCSSHQPGIKKIR